MQLRPRPVTVTPQAPVARGFASSPVQKSVIQRLVRVGPTDIDPNTGAVSRSTYYGADFNAVWQSLAGTGFRNTLNQYPAVRANFNYAFIDNALLAEQKDIPRLATAIINAVTVANLPARNALTLHRTDLELALGTHAHTNAGAGDIANFRALAAAGGAVLSRRKKVPSTISKASLHGVSVPTDTALSLLIVNLTNRNNALNNVNDYVAGWTPRNRAGDAMAGIRSPHQNGAHWLPNFTAAGAAASEAALAAAVNAAVINLNGDTRARFRALGAALQAAAAGAARASDIEDNVDASNNAALKNHFYRNVFWNAVPTKAARVQLAWARYATDWGAIANCPYIEFGGGGLASRFVWDYVNDRFFLSAHYNWVDGYNPFFEITGTPATY